MAEDVLGTAAGADAHDERPAAGARWGRLAVGVAQGAALYALWRAADAKAWPATQPALFGALVLACIAAPLILLSELGRLRRVTLVAWTVLAAAVLAWAASHNILAEPFERHSTTPKIVAAPTVWLFMGAALFIAHSLIVAADQERRWRASYPAYADTAWTRGLRLALSVGFTVAFWLILLLGAALFDLIKLKGFGELIRKPWFAIPATTMVFAAAVHLTDVRAALVRAVRSVVLALLSWLSPVMGCIAAAFLLALPFTGLEPLWATKSAAAILLAASAALIVLLNTAYQDGRSETPRLLRWTGLAIAVVVLPLVAIAAYALMLRVGQYGWTPDRIHAAACLIAAAPYAIGYPIAAARSWRGPWLKGLELANLIGAVTAVLLILALFTPIADPSRLAVADQVSRLERGAVAADRFDYRFLRFDSGRYGREALDRLAASARDPAVRRKADAARKLSPRERYAAPALRPDPARRRLNIAVYPQGRTLPEDFLAQDFPPRGTYLPQCLREDAPCDAFLIDMNADGADDIILADRNGGPLVLYRPDKDGWAAVGALTPGGCAGMVDDLRAGRMRPVTPAWSDLQVGGRRLRLQRDGGGCDAP